MNKNNKVVRLILRSFLKGRGILPTIWNEKVFVPLVADIQQDMERLSIAVDISRSLVAIYECELLFLIVLFLTVGSEKL